MVLGLVELETKWERYPLTSEPSSRGTGIQLPSWWLGLVVWTGDFPFTLSKNQGLLDSLCCLSGYFAFLKPPK